MTYVTGWYLLFLFLIFLLYFIVPVKVRWILVLIFSMAFFFLNSPAVSCIVLIASVAITYLCGIWIEKTHSIVSLIVSLAILFFPLISYRLLNMFNNLFVADERVGMLSVFVPLGMSFWTLEMASYLCDIYKGSMQACINPLKLLCFFSYFPKVSQGPIERYSAFDFFEQMEVSSYSSGHTERAVRQILCGFFLKLVIADRAKLFVDEVFMNYEHCGRGYIWIGAILYSIQIYTDFLGCMKIVIGTSALFGIRLDDNFNHPYISVSVTDFWRKWHITLSSWLRDYVYIPLGGNRKGTFRKCLNIMIVFGISGLWHGGGLSFIAWGLMHGIYQVVEIGLKELGIYKKEARNALIKGFRILVTFVLVTIAWVMFRADTLKQGGLIIGHMFFLPAISSENELLFFEMGLNEANWIALLTSIVIACVISFLPESFKERLAKAPTVLRLSSYVFVALVITIFGIYGYGYDAQDFIYRGF